MRVKLMVLKLDGATAALSVAWGAAATDGIDVEITVESVDENKENKLYINAENNDYEEDTEAERGELAENSGSVDAMSCDSIRNIKTVVLDLTAILPCGKPVLTVG